MGHLIDFSEPDNIEDEDDETGVRGEDGVGSDDEDDESDWSRRRSHRYQGFSCGYSQNGHSRSNSMCNVDRLWRIVDFMLSMVTCQCCLFIPWERICLVFSCSRSRSRGRGRCGCLRRHRGEMEVEPSIQHRRAMVTRRSVAARIRSSIRSMLLGTSFVCVLLFLELAVLTHFTYHLPLDEDGDICPSIATDADGGGDSNGASVGRWDCFLTGGSDIEYFFSADRTTPVDCRTPSSAEAVREAYDAGLFRQNYPYISCVAWMEVRTEVYLSTLSTIAALLTLVFGAGATIWGWILTRIDSLHRLRLCGFVLLLLSTLWLTSWIVGWLDRPLSIFTPLTILSLAVLMLRIRMMLPIGTRGIKEKQEEEESGTEGR